jgi:hypothetical protein
VDDGLLLNGIASLESSTHRTEQTFKKMQSTVVRGVVSRIHKVEQNNASISPSMCFSASASIDSPIVNGLLLIVETFTVLFDHFFLILLLQREINSKRGNTNNSENVTKVCQDLTSWASATGVHNLSSVDPYVCAHQGHTCALIRLWLCTLEPSWT